MSLNTFVSTLETTTNNWFNNWQVILCQHSFHNWCSITVLNNSVAWRISQHNPMKSYTVHGNSDLRMIMKLIIIKYWLVRVFCPLSACSIHLHVHHVHLSWIQENMFEADKAIKCFRHYIYNRLTNNCHKKAAPIGDNKGLKRQGVILLLLGTGYRTYSTA